MTSFSDSLNQKYARAYEKLFRFTVRNGSKTNRKNTSVNYQPLPWIGLSDSRRSQGTLERWDQMDAYIEAESSFLDIGCNVGYFVFRAAEKGCTAWGLEMALAPLVMAQHVQIQADIPNAHFFQQRITPENIGQLPQFNYISLLSVFHHWCRFFTPEIACEMGRTLIDKCDKGLFFEMGQNEMATAYQVPNLGNDPKSGVEELLSRMTDRPVTWLGENNVEVAQGTKTASRHLFLVGPRKA